MEQEELEWQTWHTWAIVDTFFPKVIEDIPYIFDKVINFILIFYYLDKFLHQHALFPDVEYLNSDVSLDFISQSRFIRATDSRKEGKTKVSKNANKKDKKAVKKNKNNGIPENKNKNRGHRGTC